MNSVYQILPRYKVLKIGNEYYRMAQPPQGITLPNLEHLQDQLSNFHPEIVHFCGHGAGKKGLVFLDKEGNEEIISTENLTDTLKIFQKRIKYVMFNACESDYQAREVSRHIYCVIGINQSIFDRSAYKFSVGFYKGLANGESVEIAYQMGCNAIKIEITKSDSKRKAIFDGDLKNQSSSPEYQKPQLYIKGNKYIVSEQTFTLSPELKQELEQEFKRKDNKDRNRYKDNAVKSYENFGRYSEQNQENPLKLEKEEKKQREIFVNKVKESWINGFLEPDLKESVTNIDLEWESRPDALDESYQSLRDTKTYTEMGQGKTLLILGEPGAGKTIALLKLAKRLLERSQQDLTLPMPVVFNLSSWASERKSIFKWLMDELREKYQVPKSISEPWLEKQQLILLLDGLDEVKEEYRNDCVRAINEFIKYNFKTEVAVCSRVKDYEALTARLKISSAICLQPLTKKQTYEFLDKMGGNLNSLKALLHSNAELEKLASNPLLVNVMSFASQGKSVKELTNRLLNVPEQKQKENIFDDYIDYRLHQNSEPEYKPNQLISWLIWIAQRMTQNSQTVFLIEGIQPSWFQTKLQRILYHMGHALTNGLILGLILGLFFGKEFWPSLFVVKFAVVIGLIGGLIGGVIDAFIGGNIKTVETFKWSWKEAKRSSLNGLIVGGIVGLIFGGIFGVAVWIALAEVEMPLIGALIYGLTFLGLPVWLIGALIVGLIGAFRGPEIQNKFKPNQGIWKSAQNALIFTLVFVLIFVLIFGLIRLIAFPDIALLWGLIFALLGGLFGGLVGGGTTCLRHFTLRLILYLMRYIPWNYAKFLDFCSGRQLMKKIGGGYVFYHRMLLEHFAEIKGS